MNNNCNHSSVTRSETWVHNSAKECLDYLLVKRNQRLQEHIDFIKKDHLKPQFRNFWNLFGKTKDTDDHRILRKYSDEHYFWGWGEIKSLYWHDEQVLKKILAATEPNLDDSHLMQLSLEDSALIEKWLNRIENKDET